MDIKKLVIYEAFARAYPGDKGKKFDSLAKDLERIKGMGINTVWLMPIHPPGVEGRKGTLGSPYAIRDYYEIDPYIGTKEDFKRFIERAHELNMFVLMDMVLNHAAVDNVLIKKHPEWFLRDEKGNFARKVPDWSDVVDFDYSNGELREYMIGMMEYWVKEFDVDGFRCDVAGLVPLDFWLQARSKLDRIKKLIWISETHDPHMYQAFDITYDYDGYYRFRDFIEGKGSLREYIDFLRMQDHIYPRGYLKMRFLENHDQPRIAKLLSREALLHWIAFLFTMKGVPLIHNGQEYGLEEDLDIFNEYTLPIPSEENDIFLLHKQFANYRLRTSVFSQGEMIFLKNDQPEKVISYLWKHENKFLLCVLNPSLENLCVTLDFSGIWSDVCIHSKNIFNNDLFRVSVRNSHAKLEIRKEPLVLSFVLY
ncbi:alpha-amylase family glycosyl hydrolase [Thermotoga sp. KOL6]|uniref:alpha-amylase family glycosyl hydrolase n=1 Tax=Thermotoga sp. KOL6 TaxID=126741 RepID=UPI000C75F6E6|nr:alpha-amylase family glycosyl hydrolase [Thermotoga sp. KOL6]PLV60311.1 alpha-amlyase [Thermotoga sp. KOL6]